MANLPTLKANATWFQDRILPDFQRTANANIPHIVPYNRNRRNIAKFFLLCVFLSIWKNKNIYRLI